MNVRRILLFLAALAAVAALAFLVLARGSFRWETREEPGPWPRAALMDDTLVLQKWLAVRGWRTRREGGTPAPAALPPDGLLILLRVVHPLTGPESEQLLAWVRGGGTLLLDATAAPFEDGEGTRAFLAKVGTTLVEVPKDHRAKGGRGTDTFDGTPLAVVRDQRWRLKVDDKAWTWWMGNDQGKSLVRRAEGKGEVLLASDLSFLYNRTFEDQDHAAWLARIMEDLKPGEAVVWSRPVEQALLPWVWAHAWRFLAALGALLVAWLWAGLWRFGPYLPSPAPGHRSILEHLTASGRFLWGSGGREALLAASRAAILKRAARSHPAFPALSRDERWAYLAQASGLPPSEIFEAMEARPGTAADAQAHCLLILQHLRHRLH